jgi:hypothetical protein
VLVGHAVSSHPSLHYDLSTHMLGEVRESQSTITNGMSFLRLQVAGQELDPEKGMSCVSKSRRGRLTAWIYHYRSNR